MWLPIQNIYKQASMRCAHVSLAWGAHHPSEARHTHSMTTSLLQAQPWPITNDTTDSCSRRPTAKAPLMPASTGAQSSSFHIVPGNNPPVHTARWQTKSIPISSCKVFAKVCLQDDDMAALRSPNVSQRGRFKKIAEYAAAACNNKLQPAGPNAPPPPPEIQKEARQCQTYVLGNLQPGVAISCCCVFVVESRGSPESQNPADTPKTHVAL